MDKGIHHHRIIKGSAHKGRGHGRYKGRSIISVQNRQNMRNAHRCRAFDTGIALGDVQSVLSREPENALSLATWFVHSSSVLEWVIAMQLVLKYARVSGQDQFKKLAYGMLPLHTSSMCACTYHFFYNSAVVEDLVSLQAGLTVMGNCTLLYAAYSIFNSNKEPAIDTTQLKKITLDTDQQFFAKALGLSLILAFCIKYGSLLIDLPFNASQEAAATIVLIPTIILSIDVIRQDKFNTGKL